MNKFATSFTFNIMFIMVREVGLCACFHFIQNYCMKFSYIFLSQCDIISPVLLAISIHARNALTPSNLLLSLHFLTVLFIATPQKTLKHTVSDLMPYKARNFK